MKKSLLSSIMALIAVFALSISALANSDIQENVGVSTLPPDDSLVVGPPEDGNDNGDEGLSPPATDNPHNLLNGKMTFSGSADISTLYTNNVFYGKSLVHIDIWNYKLDKKLEVKVFKKGNPFAVHSFSVGADSGLYHPVSGLDPKAHYYLSFSSPSNFSGSVN